MLTPHSEAATSTGGGGGAQGNVKLNVLIGPLRQPSISGPTQAELDGADTATTDWLM